MVEWCLYMLSKFDGGGSEWVWDIITADETFLIPVLPGNQAAVFSLNPHVKFKRSRSTSKQMIVVFLNTKSGHVASVALQERKTVNAKWYINTCLPKVFKAWSTHRPNTGTCGLLLHHDKLLTMTAATLDYLEVEENRIQLVTHPHIPWT